jgi:carbonic anhydrase
MINQILDGNERFVKGEFANNAEYYKTIAAAQSPQILWIGCSDSRVSEDVITNSKPGTMFVHRNIANIVSYNDVNVAAIIEYAVTYLKIPDIVVCGHTKCGGIHAIETGVEANYIADWLLISGGAKAIADRVAKEKNLSLEDKLAVLTEENVKLQITHVKNISLVKNMHRKGKIPRIHGWIYSVETGRIKVVVDGREPTA